MTDDVRRRVMKQVMTHYEGFDERDVKVTFDNLDQSAIPKVAAYYRLHIHKNARLGGKTQLPVKFYNNRGQLVSTYRINTNVDFFSNVVKSSKQLRKRRVLEKSDLKYEYVNLKTQPAKYLRDYSDAIGKEMIATIPKDSVLTEWMLRDRPVIRRGEQIDILIMKETFQLRVKGEAMDDGALGDTVQVRTLLKDRRMMKGKVIDEQTVEVRSRR